MAKCDGIPCLYSRGFLFPIALLPDWTTPISYMLPPYWAAGALHETSTGAGDIQKVMMAWGMMILFGVIDFFIASKIFQVMLYKARMRAWIPKQFMEWMTL